MNRVVQFLFGMGMEPLHFFYTLISKCCGLYFRLPIDIKCSFRVLKCVNTVKKAHKKEGQNEFAPLYQLTQNNSKKNCQQCKTVLMFYRYPLLVGSDSNNAGFICNSCNGIGNNTW